MTKLQFTAVKYFTACLSLTFFASTASSQQRNLKLPSGIIPEIVAAEANSTLLPELYERFDSRTIGESIAKRVELSNWPLEPFQKVNDRLGKLIDYDFKNQSELHLYFSENAIDGILSSGFLNAHQVDFGEKEPGYRERRQDAEAAFAKLKLEADYTTGMHSKPAVIRPKSAVLQVQLPKTVDLTIHGAQRFGELVAVLKYEFTR
jgi:hypothetical protein